MHLAQLEPQENLGRTFQLNAVAPAEPELIFAQADLTNRIDATRKQMLRLRSTVVETPESFQVDFLRRHRRITGCLSAKGVEVP